MDKDEPRADALVRSFALLLLAAYALEPATPSFPAVAGLAVAGTVMLMLEATSRNFNDFEKWKAASLCLRMRM